jgi:glycosyltransferase involved in cell wall biosynthesis
MRIGISTRGLNQSSFAISTIIYHLTKTIIELAPNDIEFFIYTNDPNFEHIFNSDTQKRSKKIKSRFIWDHVWLPPQLRNDKVDIALFMKGTLPINLPCQGVVIFHDMGYFHDKLQPYKYFETIYMKKMLAEAGKKASRIFAVSEYTRNEAAKILGINPAKISVFYPDCSPIFKPVTDPEILSTVRTSYGLPTNYIFYPSSLSPRKNYDRILDAFAVLLDQIPHHLVITGGQSWHATSLIKRIRSEFPQRIRILGNVPQVHMPALYTLAKFTIYPSLLEGFGFPILESFRCGCPVLTSNLASMPEIAGGAAYLVDPYNSEEISNGIHQLATDETLCQELVEKGFERAKIFSWRKAAAHILSDLTCGSKFGQR